MLLADQHAKGQKLSLLTLSAKSQEGSEDPLLAALDAEGSSVSVMPLDLAQKILERSAKAPTAPGFLQADLAPTSGSYAPQSSVIFGILKTLKEDFESNLSQEQKEEMKAIEDFKALSKAKTA